MGEKQPGGRAGKIAGQGSSSENEEIRGERNQGREGKERAERKDTERK
jgi:hypothetical protein